jgi:ribosomal protein S18 acetylase RimI-like enzyme
MYSIEGTVLLDNKAAADIVEIRFSCGVLRLRPERDEDLDFQYRLFCTSRPHEWDTLHLNPALRARLMQDQFRAQFSSYHAQFRNARFDIIELDGCPVGRIIVDRPGTMIHIVDQAVVPANRNRGIGTTIMQVLMNEAAGAELPVRLKVSSTNDSSIRLYLRLGFVPIEFVPLYVEMEWRHHRSRGGGRGRAAR